MATPQPLIIGGVACPAPIFLAPMCGVGDRAYLEICREVDPLSVLASEMVSAPALMNGGRNTTEMIDFQSVSGLVMVQVFGHDPASLAPASKQIEDAGAHFLSMNFGCPAKKIVKNCDGAALLRTPEVIGELVEACVKATTIPMVAKMRLGWDEDSRNFLTVAKILEEAGAHAIAVHGRTRSQGYSGTADWEAIAEIVKAVNIPIIGNGDLTSPQDALARMQKYGVAGVMIGRAAMGNPWMLRNTAALLAEGERLPDPTVAEKVRVALQHVAKLVEAKGERWGVVEARKHLSWYLGGVYGAAEARAALNKAATVAEMAAIMEGIVRAQRPPQQQAA